MRAQVTGSRSVAEVVTPGGEHGERSGRIDQGATARLRRITLHRRHVGDVALGVHGAMAGERADSLAATNVVLGHPDDLWTPCGRSAGLGGQQATGAAPYGG